jgi:hypothetical protein
MRPLISQKNPMANGTVLQDRRKAKKKRRRHAINKLMAKMTAADTPDLDRKARDLRKSMGSERGRR